MWSIYGIMLLLGTILNGLFDGFSAKNIVFIVMATLIPVAGFVLNKRSKGWAAVPIAIFFIIAAIITSISPKPEPFNTAIQINKSYALIQENDFKAAEKLLNDLYEIDQANPLVNKNLAVINLKAHKADLTKKHLDASISNLSFDEGMYYNYGMLYYQAEDYSNALKYFEKAIEQNPQMLNAHVYAGTMSFNLGNMRRSIYHLLNAEALNPQMPEIKFHLSRSHAALMEYKQAEQDLTDALELKPQPKLKAAIEELLADVKTRLKGGNGK